VQTDLADDVNFSVPKPTAWPKTLATIQQNPPIHHCLNRDSLLNLQRQSVGRIKQNVGRVGQRISNSSS